MKIKAPLLVAILGLALGSCAWFDHDSRAAGKSAVLGPVCKEKKCAVAVTVKACVITVDPSWLGLAKGVTDIEIEWQIRNSPGVAFARDGAIFFKEKDRAAAARQFRNGKLTESTKYSLWDANTAPGEFNYGVTVVDNGKLCPPLDPTIVNEM
jgi:hypothetical protein